MKKKLAVMASGDGTNLQAILDAIDNNELDAEVVVVVSDNLKAGALKRAEKAGIPTYVLYHTIHYSKDHIDRTICETLMNYQADYVVLAGYLKKIGQRVLDAFFPNIFNIHPSLLPKFGGAGMYGDNVHKAVLEAGEVISGPTVHVVDSHYDTGSIINATRVPVYEDDTADTLAARVREQEHILYPQVLQDIIVGKLVLDESGKVWYNPSYDLEELE